MTLDHEEDCGCVLCEHVADRKAWKEYSFKKMKAQLLIVLNENNGLCLDNEKEVNRLADIIARRLA